MMESHLLINTEPELSLISVEVDEMTMTALFGAMDDLLEDYTPGNKEIDDEIMQQARMIVGTASGLYGESARVMELIDMFAARLGEIACFHDHFSNELAGNTEDSHGSQGIHDGHYGHSHGPSHSHDVSVKRRKKGKSSSKPVRMTLFDFMQQYFFRNSHTTKA